MDNSVSGPGLQPGTSQPVVGGQYFRARPVELPGPSVPLTPVNYRKSIAKFKRGGRGFRGRGGRGRFHRQPKNTDAVPYPQPSDTGFQLKGALVGAQVFLYDAVAYRFLRAHRGCFGQISRQRRYEPGSHPEKTHSDTESVDSDDFPPAHDIQPVASLNLYEAYFLALVTPCLEIWDGMTGVQLRREELMVIFTDIRPLFPYFFAAYYHFRMLKYVVMSGIKFGTDFVLYEYGPLKTHSVYMAYIVVPGLRDPSMSLVDTLQRIANAAKKDALLIRVSPGTLTPDELNQSDCFSKMTVTELIVRRRERIFDHAILAPAVMPIQPVPQVNGARPGYQYQPVPEPPFPRPSIIQPYLRGPSLPTWAMPGFRGMPLPVDRGGRGRARRREGFNFHTVYLGVRRVFRGRSWSARVGADAAPQYRPPMFRGLGSWCSRRGPLQIRRPGYGNRWVAPAPYGNI